MHKAKVVAASGGGYDIIEDGEVVGHRDTLDEARAVAAIRNDKQGDVQRTDANEPDEGPEQPEDGAA